MRARHLSWLPLLFAVAWTGCATAPADGPGHPRDPYAETRREIALRPDVPDQWFMLPDVQLIGYQYARGDSVMRDTVTGAADVAVWLRSLAVRTQYESQPFHLDVREVLICDDAAVERGVFPIPGRLEGRTTRAIASRRYLALWKPEGDAWKLADIRLSPPLAVHINDLASNCSSPPVLPPGLGYGVAVGAGAAADLDAVAAAMAADGFGDLSTSGDGRPEFRVWGVQEFGDRWAARLSYGYTPESTVEGMKENIVQEITQEIGIQSHLLTLVGEVRAGPLRLGAGPALAYSRVSYLQVLARQSEDIADFSDRDDGVTQLGVVARAGLAVDVTSALSAVGTVGYGLFPEIDPPHAGIPAPITVRNLSFVLGLEYVP